MISQEICFSIPPEQKLKNAFTGRRHHFGLFSSDDSVQIYFGDSVHQKLWPDCDGKFE